MNLSPRGETCAGCFVTSSTVIPAKAGIPLAAHQLPKEAGPPTQPVLAKAGAGVTEGRGCGNFSQMNMF
jgi:hypothetical protein